MYFPLFKEWKLFKKMNSFDISDEDKQEIQVEHLFLSSGQFWANSSGNLRFLLQQNDGRKNVGVGKDERYYI